MKTMKDFIIKYKKSTGEIRSFKAFAVAHRGIAEGLCRAYLDARQIAAIILPQAPQKHRPS